MMAPRALRAATDLLERLPEIEAAVIGAADRAQSTLDELLDRVRPIETELQEVQVSAKTLERQLAETERQIAVTDRKAGRSQDLVAQLIELVIRVEGAAEHFLDKVPGLSAERAEERADEIARETERPGLPRTPRSRRRIGRASTADLVRWTRCELAQARAGPPCWRHSSWSGRRPCPRRRRSRRSPCWVASAATTGSPQAQGCTHRAGLRRAAPTEAGLKGVVALAGGGTAGSLYAIGSENSAITQLVRGTSPGKLDFAACLTGNTFIERSCPPVPGAYANSDQAPIAYPTAAAISPDGRWLYLVSGSFHGSVIARFSREPLTGALTYVDCLTGDTEPSPTGVLSCTLIPGADPRRLRLRASTSRPAW